MPKTLASVKIEDKSGQFSTITFTVNDTLAGFTNLNTIATEMDTLVERIKDVTVGAVRTNTISIKFDEDVAAVPDGSRELKWLVTYRDETQFLDAANLISNPGFGKLFSYEIPTADENLIPLGEEDVDLTEAPWTNFVTAFEQVVRSPFNRSAANPVINVLSIRKVGRNI